MNMMTGKKIGREPWHISYLPIAEQAQAQFTPEILIHSWCNEHIEGKHLLQQNMEQIWCNFIP